MTSGELQSEILTCPACGALVAAALAQKHEEFHTDLLSKREKEAAAKHAKDLRSSR